ncbi:RNA-binding protein [Oleomonas cavernae]|nr:RNA-binding protein [Oleomonas cavernae]
MNRPPLTPSPDAPTPSADASADDGPGPIRRCIATGDKLPRETMIRYVVSPGGELVPDLKAVLPGRGFWTQASRAAVDLALKKGLFRKAAARGGLDGQLTLPEGLSDRLELLLTRRCLDFLGLARRAGEVIAGFDKIETYIRKSAPGLPPIGALLAASDGAADGKRKLKQLARDTPRIEILTCAELSLALGRENVIHAAFKPGRLADQFLGEARRLAGFRVLDAAFTAANALGRGVDGMIDE